MNGSRVPVNEHKWNKSCVAFHGELPTPLDFQSAKSNYLIEEFIHQAIADLPGVPFALKKASVLSDQTQRVNANGSR